MKIGTKVEFKGVDGQEHKAVKVGNPMSFKCLDDCPCKQR